MIIEKELLFEGALGERSLLTLFDTGATYSCIHPEYARQLAHIEPIRHPFRMETAKEGESLEVKEAVRLDFYMEGYRFSDEFMLVPHLSEQAIIGAKTMQSWRFKLDFEHDVVIIDPKVTKLRLL